MEYLLLNNCLSVAAAGNDSLQRVELHRPRFGPRIPARYPSVLGVAATTRDPSHAAAYSNIGDEFDLGDHIATFGGDVTPRDEPKDAVIGVFSARGFPRRRGTPAIHNENGWASWSGTSFATAIISGIISGYWTLERRHQPNLSAEDVLVGFSKLARDYAPALRTSSLWVKGVWQHM